MNQFKYLLVLVLSSFCAVTNAKIIYCYFGTWANYRPGNGKFTSSDVDPHLCTHLSYAFFGIRDTGEINVLDSWLDFDLGSIKKTMDLKLINPDLKVLASVGGWNEGSTKYSEMAASPTKRKTFISSSLKFMQEHGFDGLDLDWEYPGQRGGSTKDKQNFVILLKEMKEAFKPLKLELSIAVGASAYTGDISYDIPGISKQVDFINVMTYDLAMSSDGKLGFNAALTGEGQINVQDCIQYWLDHGAPADKLVLGLAFYGHTFQLADTQKTTPGSPCYGNGDAGPYTRQPGYLGYNEICTIEPSWNVVFDEEYGCPYMYKGNQWVGYDNVRSIEMKMDYMNSLNLAGVMMWSIETDDFRGECGEKYPLLKTMNRKLGKDPGNDPDPDPESNTTQSEKPVPSSSPPPNHSSGEGCSQEGIFSNESDCSRFYQCVGGIRYDFDCPSGLKFDFVSSTCTWPEQATC